MATQGRRPTSMNLKSTLLSVTKGSSTADSSVHKFAAALEEAEQDFGHENYSVEALRIKIKKFMSNSTFGFYYDHVILVVSFSSLMLYVFQTYLNTSGADDRERYISVRCDILEVGLAILIFCDWSLNMFLSDHRLSYFTSSASLRDIFIIVPSFITIGQERPDVREITDVGEALTYAMFAMRPIRILRALILRKQLVTIEDAVQRYIGEISLSISLMILFFAAVMQFLEREYQSMDFHTWVYYIWVTISTVGYGDFSPTTNQGRIAAMAIIGFSIISIPKMTNELIEKMNLESFYARVSYHPKTHNSNHIVICGDMSSTSLKEFFNELFHEDHENVNLNAVILMPTPPSVEILLLLRDPNFFLSLTYLEGSALVDSDLRRAKAETAVAIFILTNKFSTNPDEEDAKSILLNLSIKRYVSQFHLPAKLFCMQLIRPQNIRHLSKEDASEILETDLVVCLNEIKMGVMAKAVMYPGANTLLMNLISSFSDDPLSYDNDEEDLDQMVIDHTGQPVSSNAWIQEYQKGCDWEIYTTSLSDIFIGAKFCELSYALYEKIGVVLFALQLTEKSSKTSRLLLNPADFIIPKKEDYLIEAFVIAKNKASSDLSFKVNRTAHEGRGVQHFSSFLSNAAFSSAETLGVVNSHRRNTYFGRKTAPEKPQSGHDDSIAEGDDDDDDQDQEAEKDKKKTSKWNVLKRRALLEKKIESFSYQEILHQLEDKHLNDNFYIRSYPAEFQDCEVRTNVTDEVPYINNHIIIIGKGLKNLADLIRPLRAKYLGSLRYIVILYSGEFPIDLWNRVSMFDAILLVRGSSLEERNLRRAGIFRAQQVVVLADGNASETQKSGMAALVDSDAIFTYQCVKRMNPNAQVVVEIVNTSNISYVDDDSKRPSDDYKFSSQFAAGTLFTTSLLDSIVCQAYYNPQIIKVMNKLISGVDHIDALDLKDEAIKKSQSHPVHETPDPDPSETDNIKVAPTAKSFFAKSKKRLQTPGLIENLKKAKGSCLYQMSLPENFAKKTYGELYSHLSKQGMVPLGLLRGTFSQMSMGPKANKFPYVYTNPDKDVELFTCDRVFVLSLQPITITGKMDIKDWILDLQMAKSREAEEISPPGMLTRRQSVNNFNSLEKSQKQLENRVTKLSTELNKKLNNMVEMLNLCVENTKSGNGSPSFSKLTKERLLAEELPNVSYSSSPQVHSRRDRKHSIGSMSSMQSGRYEIDSTVVENDHEADNDDDDEKIGFDDDFTPRDTHNIYRRTSSSSKITITDESMLQQFKDKSPVGILKKDGASTPSGSSGRKKMSFSEPPMPDIIEIHSDDSKKNTKTQAPSPKNLTPFSRGLSAVAPAEILLTTTSNDATASTDKNLNEGYYTVPTEEKQFDTDEELKDFKVKEKPEAWGVLNRNEGSSPSPSSSVTASPQMMLLQNQKKSDSTGNIEVLKGEKKGKKRLSGPPAYMVSENTSESEKPVYRLWGSSRKKSSYTNLEKEG